MTFQKRGRDIVGMDFLLNPEYPEPMVLLPNIVTFLNSTDTINMFQEHIKSDKTVFSYTAMDGQKKEFRFSLAGFNEKYLEQFVSITKQQNILKREYKQGGNFSARFSLTDTRTDFAK